MMCNYATSNGSRCYYFAENGLNECYFHDKVKGGLITGYYEQLVAADDSRGNRWVGLS
jgi:hypothetical protein